ncbi:SDR family NAD(P)-dependent oxidoreductase, partial [Streptomyces sp. NPDC091682]|uniref:type I polyketide synthase n=1 Tax=Streptomyces sp. NPDC091682 TaxID=3366005 RepID=UPI0037FC371C
EASVEVGQWPSGVPVPWVVSGSTPEALRAQAARLHEHVVDGDLSPADVGFSLASTRAVLDHRAVVLGTDRDALLAGLAAIAAGETDGEHGPRAATSDGQTAFLFTGQGAQRLGMGHELARRFPVFAAALDKTYALLDTGLDRPLREVVAGEQDGDQGGDQGGGQQLLDQTAYTQAALFAVEVALFRLVESFGLRPDFLAGHSVGEIAAAHVSGILSLEDACRLVAARGRLMQALPAGGVMVAVRATEADVLPLLDGREDRVGIAAVNGPRSVVISGEQAAVAAVVAELEDAGFAAKQLNVSHAFHSPLMDPMLDEFRHVVQELEFGEPRIAVVSNVTGQVADAGELSDPEYWVRHVRQAVRFADGIRTLEAAGVTTFVELGPDGVLSAMAQASLADTALLVPVLRKDRDEASTLLTALARAFEAGTDVNWPTLYAGSGARRVDLPTYAFQRERYWLDAVAAAGDASTLGQVATAHPFLGAAVELPNSEAYLLTGRVGLDTQPWLADHAVAGAVLLPGTAFVDMAIRAGTYTGHGFLEELTLQAPLVLTERGGAQIRVSVGDPDETGRLPLSVYSRTEDLAGERPWLLHATGTLTDAPPTQSVGFGVWPPKGATAVGLDDLYAGLAADGLQYGTVFQGLKAAWRRGSEVFAEVALPEEAHGAAAAFGLHPALLDAALHATELLDNSPRDTKGASLPFAWSGVSLLTPGVTSLRVRVTSSAPDESSLTITDSAGLPVMTVASMAARPVSVEQIEAARGGGTRPPYRLEWTEHPLDTAPAAGRWVVVGTQAQDWASAPAVTTATDLGAVTAADVVLLPAGSAASGFQAVRAETGRVLEALQTWLAEERFESATLAVVTTRAVSAGGSGTADLAGASVRGLVRSAQLENPGRIVLVDLDGSELSLRALPAALATGEPELALREGAFLVPRLAATAAADPVEFDTDGTVLITGGTGGLGSLVARHLVAAHGVQHLLLVSRRGEDAPGVDELREELADSGAKIITVAACDTGDRDALAALLKAVPAEHPLTGVVHTAGVVDDGTIPALTAGRLDTVLRPKADAAWHLHELTADLDLSAFVLFSSVAGTLDGAGQGNYAAANSFLDALARQRREAGLAGLSLAWGLWDSGTGMGSRLTRTDVKRLNSGGLVGLSAEDSLALLDAALGSDEPFLVPVRLDPAALRARPDGVPALLRGLVAAPAARAPRAVQATADPLAGETLEEQLAGLSQDEQLRLLQSLICAHVAAVLGHSSAALVDPARSFQEVGFDSLTAIELRNRLNKATGQRLPATLIFDYPSPVALSKHLLEELLPDNAAAPTEVPDEEAFRRTLGAIPLDRIREAGLLDALLALVGTDEAVAAGPQEDRSDTIMAMDIEALMAEAAKRSDSE